MPQAAKGFSLLETLVAFAVLAVCMGVLLRVFSGAGHATGVANQYAQAVSLAESQLAILLGREYLLPGTYEGPVGDGSRWIMRVAEAPGPLNEDPGRNMALMAIDLSIVWGEGEEPREYTVSTMRLVPLQREARPGWHLRPRPPVASPRG